MNPAEFSNLISLLSVPRPNGSRALDQTVAAVRSWLEENDIPAESHRFTLYPYFMELLGLWLALAGLLLPVAALGRWRWGGLVLALLAVAIPLLEVRFLRPTITTLIRQPAENLVVSFPVPSAISLPFAREKAVQEVIFCAHLDSKTELLDHYQRSVLLRWGLPAMGLALASGALTALEGMLPGSSASDGVRWLACLAALPAAAYGLGMGANLVGGRLGQHPSTGAVDNGAGVVILLALAQRLRRGESHLDRTSVTLLLPVGEEAQMQGALAYVRDRKWKTTGPDPTVYIVNLEVMGQSGGYVLWEEDGTAMVRLPTDPALNRRLEQSIEAVTGERSVRVSAVSSDAFAFLQQGLPATTLGSFDLELGGRGFHSALDSPVRVDVGRLAESVDILSHFLKNVDSKEKQ